MRGDAEPSPWDEAPFSSPRTVESRSRFDCAVLVCIVGEDSGDGLLLARRRAGEGDRYHGQMCFPGGCRLPGETAWETAVREFHEETGLGEAPTMIGLLDEFRTAGGEIVIPVLARTPPLPGRLFLQGDGELDRLLIVSLEELDGAMRHGSPPGVRSRRNPALWIDTPVGPVWGLTASIVALVLNVLRGRRHAVDRMCGGRGG